jgi:hypothetical protein
MEIFDVVFVVVINSIWSPMKTYGMWVSGMWLQTTKDLKALQMQQISQ